MIIKYETPLRLRHEDFTREGRVRMSSLLHAFQDIAGAHAEREGLGFEALLERNLIWVVTKIKVRVSGEIREGGEYTLVTYPRHTSTRIFEREFYILSQEGEELAAASSEWCVVNFVTRRVEQTDLNFKGEYTDRAAIPEGIERLRPRELTRVGSHTVTQEDLDGNEHTNNCRYADMAFEILGRESASEFTISFARETRLGDEIELLISPEGVVAGRHDGATVFTALAK